MFLLDTMAWEQHFCKEKEHMLKDFWNQLRTFDLKMVLDPQRRPFINIMALSDEGLVFIKEIDGLGKFKDKHYIAGVLKDAIKEIGHEKVVQVIDRKSVV